MIAPRGYTLIEVLVALGLLSIVMVGAGGLIVSTIALSDRTVRSLRDPEVVVAMLRVRRDVQTGTGLVGATTSGAWSEEPLLVRRPDAGVTAYGWDGDTLRRWTWEPDGRATDAVIVVRGVVSWRWRWPGGSAVDVQLETSTASRRVAVGAGEAPDARSTRRETWRFAMRGTRVGSGW